jgi:DNA polymerase-3 subunit epsilon/ATP-dependent DNA helicase DinG
MPRTYIALDLELTGLDRKNDEIIEIALVRFRGQETLESWSSLVHTKRAIPPRIQQLVGIAGRDLAGAPELDSLRSAILRFVGSTPLVGHSIETDLFFLQKQGITLHNLALDTFELASILVPEARTYSLSALSELLGIALPEAHRALQDAIATKDLFAALYERFEAWDAGLLQELYQAAQQTGWALAPLLQDLVEEKRAQQPLLGGQPAAPAWRAGEYGFVPRERDGFPPLNPSGEITPVDPEPLVEALSPGGALSRAFPGYEYRPQQVEMLNAVVEAFNTPTHLLVEAGTGTGKSLAYLLPAIQFATQNEMRVVVSSNTINLQDQLYTKDVPDLQHILPAPFRATILKGRGNYICLRRLAAFRRARQLSLEGARVLAKVLAWLPKTVTGDQAELLLVNDEFSVWQELQATSETCMGDRCPYLGSGRCFFFRARARAERAHLIIVNHALLLSDLAMESRVLPDYRYLIIDEAHHLEEQATSQFGLQVARNDLASYFGALGQPSSAAPSGLLGQIPGLFHAFDVSETMRQSIADRIQRINEEIDAGLGHMETLYRALDAFMQEYQEAGGRSQGPYDRHVRITSGLRVQPGWSEIEIAWDNLAAPLRQIVQGLEQLGNWIQRLPEEQNEERFDLLQQVKTQLQRGHELCDGLEGIILEPTLDYIYWASVSQYNQEVALNSAPLSVGDMLEERLFAEKDCVVLTSATLRTDQEFNYIKDRLGLETPLEVALDSPFDFQSAVLLYVPKDIPEPNEPYYQKSVEEAIVNLVRATEGRALVLFTSTSQLNNTYRATQGALEKEGITVFGQGIDGSRRQILDGFRNTSRAVLMGTRSFWEGVDVVGQALSCLIITRLPFGVPTDPILAARAETFDDPFNQYYLPETILRFRQGFGRLIRSREDYGIVAVLDKRLLTKPYGKAILRSLPRCTARMGPVSTLPLLAERWLHMERVPNQ